MSGSGLLTRRIERFETRNDSVSESANRLRELGVRVCSFENLTAREPRPLILTGATVSQLLDRIIERNPGYRWEESSVGLTNVFPTESVLNSLVHTAAARSKGAWRWLEEDLRIAAWGISLFQEFGDPDGPPVNLALKDTELRAVLNAIVLQLDQLAWHIAGRPRAYHLSFTNVPVS